MAKLSHWLTSTEARKQLRINSCQLMHRREAGLLVYKKIGNAFFYLFEIELDLNKDVADAKASSR